ncbi:MAG: hypothetical protein ABIU87_01805 [Ornithinibacter sp.]
MTPIAKWLLAVAMHLLPRQSHRRYENQFDAELLSLSRSARPGYALSVLGATPRLRWSLLATLSGGHASLRCWLVKHHDRIVHPNPDDHLTIALSDSWGSPTTARRREGHACPRGGSAR